MGWPGFQQAPQVPNTARNTDGLWVIHRASNRDTNNVLQHVTMVFLFFSFFNFTSFYYLPYWLVSMKKTSLKPNSLFQILDGKVIGELAGVRQMAVPYHDQRIKLSIATVIMMDNAIVEKLSFSLLC